MPRTESSGAKQAEAAKNTTAALSGEMSLDIPDWIKQQEPPSRT